MRHPNAPEGCPECGDLRTEPFYVSPTRIKRACVCGHRWTEDRDMPVIRVPSSMILEGANDG